QRVQFVLLFRLLLERNQLGNLLLDTVVVLQRARSLCVEQRHLVSHRLPLSFQSSQGNTLRLYLLLKTGTLPAVCGCFAQLSFGSTFVQLLSGLLERSLISCHSCRDELGLHAHNRSHLRTADCLALIDSRVHGFHLLEESTCLSLRRFGDGFLFLQ